MRYTLRIAEDAYTALEQHVAKHLPREVGALLLVGRARDSRTETLLVRRAVLLEPDAFDVQESYQLVIKPRVINGAIGLCEANGLGIVFCHSHPGDIPYSVSDDAGEARLKGVFEQCLPHVPFGSLLFCPKVMFGRVWTTATHWEPIDSLRVLGATIRDVALCGSSATDSTTPKPEFDRQIRALRDEGQKRLSRTRVGIVGLGGTGSPTAEQLVRLGVRNLVLIDRDTVDETTLTRGYGTFRDHVTLDGKKKHSRLVTFVRRLARGNTSDRTPVHKVVAVAEHLRRIAPDTVVTPAIGDVVETETARLLLDRDIVFSCLDEHWGRAVINQLAYQYLIPTINFGVRLDVNHSGLQGAAGSIQVLRPSAACLWCAGLLSPERIRAETLSAQQRRRLQEEKYVIGLDTPAPSVVSLTTTLSGLAVTQALQLLTGFLGQDGGFKRLNYFIPEATIHPGETPIRELCLCRHVAARGDMLDLPTVERRSSGEGAVNHTAFSLLNLIPF